MDRPLDVDPAVRRALLAAEPERATRMIPSAASSRSADCGGRSPGSCRPSRRCTAAGSGSRSSGTARSPTSYEPVNTMPSMPGFVLELVADRVARTHHEVEHAVGHARVAVRLEDRDRRHRRRRRRLEHDRVAGHHRRARRPDGERHREVERADHREHAVRAEDRPGVDRRVAQVVHRVVVERVVLGRLRVVADEVGRLLDLAQRLEPGLADLDRHQARVLHLALADQLRGRLQDLEPPLPAEPEPGRLRPPRGRDRVLDVGCGCPSRTCRRGSRCRSASGPRTSRRRRAPRRR